jgi:hypothetical protein
MSDQPSYYETNAQLSDDTRAFLLGLKRLRRAAFGRGMTLFDYLRRVELDSRRPVSVQTQEQRSAIRLLNAIECEIIDSRILACADRLGLRGPDSVREWPE